jgi:CHAT domain-containing protein
VSELGQLSVHFLREAQRHVESCEDCGRKVQAHKSIQGKILRMRASKPSPPNPECIGDAEWLEVAAGLYPDAKARQLMKHAAQCGHCGPLLKNVAETLADETTPREETLLTSLNSARPEWQKDMAATLRSNGGTQRSDSEKRYSVHWGRALFSWPRAAFVFAGIALAVMVGWLGRDTLRPLSAEELLARAYTEHRTLEVRIPGAKFAPMRVERTGRGSDLEKSPSLLKAEALIADNLRKNPNEPAWLQAKARADLLDGNYESAIKSLQRALEAQPDDPALLTDLGSAYFVRAAAGDRPIDYGNAVEALSKALARAPNDPVALFNRALACEHMFLYTQAVDDWEHYLHVDPRGEWADAARDYLQRVKQTMADREKRATAPLLSPKEFSAAIDENHGDTVEMLDQRAELYLETAIQSWLPQAYGDNGSSQNNGAEARRAIGYLADLLESRHNDSWLSDFLQSPPDPTQREALHFLLAGDEALHIGRYGLAAELAERSQRDFQRSRNQAGSLRASFALMLAQTLQFNPSRCLRTGISVTPLLSTTHYRWLQAQTLIQQGQCQEAIPEVEKAIESTSKAIKIAERCHYPGLELRATAFAAVYRGNTGSADRGLRDLIGSLATFWKSDVADARGENLYSVLFNVAWGRNWNQVAESAITEKIKSLPERDPVDQAVGLELLAAAQERIRDYTAAQATLQKAAERLAALPADRGTILRKSEIALEAAGIQLDLGDPKGALATLAGLSPRFDEADPGLFQAEYFETYGETYLALGLNRSAEPLLERALVVTETGLNGLPSEVDKLEWSRTEGQIYRDLLAIRLTSESPAEALAWWEWYKSASLRAATKKRVTLLNNASGDSIAPPAMSSYLLPPGAALISYVLSKDSTTAFVFRDGNVQSHVMQVADDANLRVLRFLNLCADPMSDLHYLNNESRRLYGLLVAPLESDIQGATVLRFETDGILDRVPFDLLQTPDGRYLGDRFEVTYSPGLAYGSRSTADTLSPSSAALIVIAAGSQDPSLIPLPEANEEGNDVAAYFRDAHVLSGLRSNRADVLRSLRDASVFHFAGHALAGVDGVGLVLGSGAILTSGDLVKLRPRNLKLAVLSACETAGGEDGSFADLNSIARTLAVAGVPQTVASRWKVDSTVTRQLMKAFYSNLMSGKTAAESLNAATLAVRTVPGYEHPYYWGSFAVFGD